MKNCRACQQSIPDDARFCPYCGVPVIESTVDCPRCGQENDFDAAVCSLCGFVFSGGGQEAPKPPPNNIFDNTPTEKMEQAVADRFSIAFERRLTEEHKPSLHNAYIDRFYKSDFRQGVEYRIRQLAEQLSGVSQEKARNAVLAPAFEDLLDYFIIRYCTDLNEARFPEAILRYQGLSPAKIDLRQMIFDYLDFENEEETVYTDFVTMPPHKLKNAATSFLSPHKGETLFFISDWSLLGNCKEGFAMTDECIYWKTSVESRQRVYYKNLSDIRRHEDWITINGIYFNSSNTLNVKLLRLLKKLRGWRK